MSVYEGVVERKHLNALCRNINWYCYFRKHYEDSSKTEKARVTALSSNPCVYVYPKKLKYRTQRDIHISTFTEGIIQK